MLTCTRGDTIVSVCTVKVVVVESRLSRWFPLNYDLQGERVIVEFPHCSRFLLLTFFRLLSSLTDD